ncbi:MAG TPA: Ig-like domain-containing protein [Verrucomicrobiae bacterium]|nr:Ig-like domain-containing protein [Verrucomicrobiae bacterium]
MRTRLFHKKFAALLGAWLFLAAAPAFAAQITLTGDAQKGPLTTGDDGKFTLVNVPLRSNSVNRFKVTAKDGSQEQSQEVLITQISLQSVVVSKIKSTPLTVQQIEQLVNDGVIDIDDPSNFNVSVFQIVLTIGGREVGIDVPMVRGLQEDMGEEDVAPKSDPGDGRSNPNPPEVVVFEVEPPPIPGQPPAPPIPGVLIIEGRIKTLKEFYSVRLLLMNTSGIFTLHDVTANIEFPDGGLSSTLPQDGIVQFGDILPGDGETPGQKEREFIIRGDEIGVRGVKVNFGGTIIGGGIPDDVIIPFNGSADTTVEVKGPPEFRVQVIHPPAVVQDVPYELIVDIQNVGDTPALYTSFELDVGADGNLVDCTYDEALGNPVCLPIVGSAVRNIGHLMPGESTRQSFMINPHVTGPITSCIAVADQNIDLQVHVGNQGCIVGQRSIAKSPDGIPTMSVLPAANALGVGIDAPVVAIFNEKMNESTINLSTIQVLDDQGAAVPGNLRIVPLGDHTAAIFQVLDGITNRWKGNTTYTIQISDNIFDLQGNKLVSPWTSEFTTTDPTNDITPPTVTLSIEPPVNPSQVLPGQIIRLNAYASDQGTHVARVELRMQDTDDAVPAYELIDQKTVFPEQSGPIIFSVDSANLTPGHIYQFKATAFDNVGNSQNATIAAVIAQNAAAPTVQLPNDPAAPVLYGISLTLVPENLTGGVKQVDYYLDAASTPFATLTVAPYSVTVDTLGKTLGAHTIRAVATDGLGQTGQDVFGFQLAANPNEPIVDFGGAIDGQQYVVGKPLSVNGSAADPTGIQGVAFFLDNTAGTPVALSTEPFDLDTTGLSLGNHKLIFKATNKAGVSNDLNDPDSVLEFKVVAEPPPGPPPAAPQVTNITFPVNGQVTLTGTSVANARIDISNLTQGTQESIFADGAGAFQIALAAQSGDQIRLIAFNLSQSLTGSNPTNVVVPAAPVLDHITVSPSSRTFTAVNDSQEITVTGFYVGGAQANITSQATFSSNNTAVATVNADGRVADIANGNALITATVGTKTAQVNVTVNIVTLTGVSIDPTSFTLFGLNKTRQLSVIGSYSNGSTAPIPAGSVAFGSTNIAVAAVNASGLVTSISTGNAVISASVAGFAPAQTSVTVAPIAPTGISVSPNAILFTSKDETRQLDITVNFNDGTTGSPQSAVDYDSDHTDVATVDANGLVTAVANGDATITVQHQGFTADVTISVDIPDATTPPPEITQLDRAKAGEGDIFTIFGKNFAAVPGDNLVRVNGIQAVVQSARQDELAVVVPAGATSGPVNVEVNGKVSNDAALVIYGRLAKSFLITPAVDVAASAGAKLLLSGPTIDFRAGDKVYLSSAPDVLAPLSYTGQLRARVDGGAFSNIGASGQVIELTSLLTAGSRTVDLDLGESAGRHKTAAIYLVAGPNNTGVISGFRSIMANGQSRSQAVTILNLTDLAGNPYPNGSKVAVTVEAHCFRDRSTSGCIASHGGSITNGEGNSPDGFGLRVFTVQNRRIDVVYDPGSSAPLNAWSLDISNIQVLPANSNGSRTSDTALAYTPVTLTSFESVGTTRSQTSVVADGLEKILTVTFTGARDTAGQPVPDGTPFVVTVEPHCFRDASNSSCIGSAGGSLLSGDASPDGFGLRRHVLAGGEAEVQYSPGGTTLPYPNTAIANLQFLPSRPNGSRIGDYAFQFTPVTLSSAQSPTVSSASSVYADTGDNRVIVTLSDFKDSLGNPVPDGTKVVVTAEAHCFRNASDNSCIGSAGGVIISGTNSPDGFGLKVHDIQNGQTQVTYSALGVGMQTLNSGTVNVQVLPSRPNGSRIGDYAIVAVPFAAAGVQAAISSANPTAVVADGSSKSVTITLTNIRDTSGNVLPDGAQVVLTAEGHCFRNPSDNSCIDSRGGLITTGTASPDGFGLKVHVVSGGQITATYDPSSVALEFPDVQTARIQVLPAKPNGGRLGDYAFAVVPVALSSIQQAQVSVVPPSVFADNSANLSVITLSNIKDAAGNNVPNGSKVVATAGAFCFRNPTDNTCVDSRGGAITTGTASPDGFDLKAHTVQSGSTQITYSAAPIALEAREAALANVQILPSQPNGSRIGNRAFTLAPVTLAGYQSADVTGPGQVTPGGTASYVVSNIRDTSGNLVPDGAKVLVTASAVCFRDPETNNCIGSAGGGVTNGTASPDGFDLKAFAIQGGQFTVQFQAPAGTGVSVLQLLPGKPGNQRTGNKAFTLKSISVQNAGG